MVKTCQKKPGKINHRKIKSSLIRLKIYDWIDKSISEGRSIDHDRKLILDRNHYKVDSRQSLSEELHYVLHGFHQIRKTCIGVGLQQHWVGRKLAWSTVEYKQHDGFSATYRILKMPLVSDSLTWDEKKKNFKREKRRKKIKSSRYENSVKRRWYARPRDSDLSR